jgi:hypothetical protein
LAGQLPSRAAGTSSIQNVTIAFFRAQTAQGEEFAAFCAQIHALAPILEGRFTAADFQRPIFNGLLAASIVNVDFQRRFSVPIFGG